MNIGDKNYFVVFITCFYNLVYCLQVVYGVKMYMNTRLFATEYQINLKTLLEKKIYQNREKNRIG